MSRHGPLLLLLAALTAGAAAQQVPDFALVDTNPRSVRFGTSVSPRDYVLQVCGFYFGTASG